MLNIFVSGFSCSFQILSKYLSLGAMERDEVLKAFHWWATRGLSTLNETPTQFHQRKSAGVQGLIGAHRQLWSEYLLLLLRRLLKTPETDSSRYAGRATCGLVFVFSSFLREKLMQTQKETNSLA